MKKPAFIYLSGHRFHIAIIIQAWYNKNGQINTVLAIVASVVLQSTG